MYRKWGTAIFIDSDLISDTNFKEGTIVKVYTYLKVCTNFKAGTNLKDVTDCNCKYAFIYENTANMHLLMKILQLCL